MTRPGVPPATRSRRLAAIGLLAGLVAASVAVPTTPAEAAPISCYSNSDNDDTWYNGPSASFRYDYRFGNKAGPRVGKRMRDTHVPQGMTTWRNWNGGTADLLLMTGYGEDGRDSWVQGINPRTGNKTRIIRIQKGHVGGIAIVGKWAFVSHTNGKYVRSYRLRDFRRVLNGKANGNYVTWERISRVYASSFLASANGQVFAGKHDPDSRNFMKRYTVNQDNGALTQVGRRIQVPKKTQGLAITKNQFIYSTSRYRTHRSNIYVVDRGYRWLDNAPLTCFRAPSMSEGITLWGGKAWLLFESGSYKYRASSRTRNVIKRVHKAPVSRLLSIPRTKP